MNVWWKLGAAMFGIVSAVVLAGACQHGSGQANGGSVTGESRVTELRRYCIEQHGGVALDAVDVYGGRLSVRCTRWAYGRAQSWQR
ncbi:MAG: hypothetical protein RIB46_15570 [Pseudomonadales bacterium]